MQFYEPFMSQEHTKKELKMTFAFMGLELLWRCLKVDVEETIRLKIVSYVCPKRMDIFMNVAKYVFLA